MVAKLGLPCSYAGLLIKRRPVVVEHVSALFKNMFVCLLTSRGTYMAFCLLNLLPPLLCYRVIKVIKVNTYIFVRHIRQTISLTAPTDKLFNSLYYRPVSDSPWLIIDPP